MKDEEANGDKEMGSLTTKAEIKDEAANDSVNVEKAVKAEKVEANIKSEGNDDKVLIETKVEAKHETSDPLMKIETTENSTNSTNISTPKPGIKNESPNKLIKTEDAGYKLNGDGSPTKPKLEAEEKKTDILIKTESAKPEMDDVGDEVTTKNSVLAGIKREAPEDSDEKGDVSSRSKRARRRGLK